MSAADRDHLKIFAGRSGRAIAEKTCEYLNMPLGQGRGEQFPDGEIIVKVDEDVRG
ncbi:MAG: ribose-phosphate pyrophosphokinase-like domain-containing protein, partial [Planctomycetota bacterium]